MERPEILMIGPYPARDMAALEADYILHKLWEAGNPGAFLQAHGARIRAIATRGDLMVAPDLVAALPALEIIVCFGVGTDGIPFEQTRPRGIKVTNTPDVLTDDVADLAIGLMISVARTLPAGERLVRSGAWAKGGLPLARKVSGKRLGIVGLGRIGQAIARRAQAFDMDIAYYNRSARPDVPYRRHEDVVELAGAVDFLVVAISAAAETANLIDARVLAALGPDGYLINVARGAVVDEEALIAALMSKSIKGAALDVFQNEPNIDARFFTLENAVLTPHVGSATSETRGAMGQLARDNLTAHFKKRPLLTEVR